MGRKLPTIKLGRSKISRLIEKQALQGTDLPDGVTRVHFNTGESVRNRKQETEVSRIFSHQGRRRKVAEKKGTSRGTRAILTD